VKKDYGSPGSAEAVAHPASLMMASWGIGLLTLRRRPAKGAPPARTLRRPLSGDGPLILSPLASCGPGRSVHPGRACRRRRAAAHAGAGTGRCNGNSSPASALSSLLGEAQLLAGCLEEAHTLAEQAWARACEHEEHANQAYSLRLLGEIAARRDPPQIVLAEAHYWQALALAEALGMQPLVAHCHLGLGTLYSKVGRQDQARAELSITIELYRTLDMTFWLPQAEAALAEGH
jgi:hypothetical protein